MEPTNTGGVNKFIIGAVVILAIVGVYMFMNSPKEGDPAFEKKEAAMMQVDSQADTMMKKDEGKVEGSMMNVSMKIALATLNNSGVKGEAVLTPKGEKTEVTLTLVGATPDAHPAHIHEGACPMLGAVKYPLSPVVGGKSVTLVDASIDQLWKMLPLGINAHKSAAELKTYLVCGDLKNAVKAEMGGAMMKKEGDVMVKEDTMMKADAMMKVGSYEAYAPEKIAKAAATGNVVLFFHASWCPTCRALDADLKANLGKIPGNLTILDVDYDNSTELKKKYGVTYQHTFIQVDKDGVMIKKWMGSQTLETFLKEVK